MKSNGHRIYQVHFIWIRDAAKFAHYGELVAPIASRYGAIERTIEPEKIYLEGRAKPDLVNVVYYDSEAQFEAFPHDPEFQKIVHLRSESTDLLSVAGEAVEGTAPGSDGLARRLYLVEIARFGAEGYDGYRRYEAEAEPVLRRYGYHVERVIRVKSASGAPFRPDLVKVVYFSERDGMARMETAPEHARIEGLYPAAVPESIWVFGPARTPAPR
jgi:uncharacterized protein (DUF1330 family)